MVEEVLVAAVVAVVVGSQGGGKRQSQDNVLARRWIGFHPDKARLYFSTNTILDSVDTENMFFEQLSEVYSSLLLRTVWQMIRRKKDRRP